MCKIGIIFLATIYKSIHAKEKLIMNIEKLLDLERQNSYKLIKSKVPYMGQDFIEDVFCDARLKALKNIKSYDQNRPFRNWWTRILINSLTDKINKNKQEVSMEYIEEKTYDPMQEILSHLAISELINILDSLPNQQRNVIKKIIEEETKFGNYSVSKKTPAERLSLHKARKKINKILETNYV